MTFVRWSEDKAREAYSLREAGMSSQQIANSWGVSRNVIVGLVWRAKKQFGLPPLPEKQFHPKRPPRPRKPRQPRAIVAAKAKTVTVVLSRAPDAPSPLMVTLLDLQAHHCRWPEGLGKGLQSTYCGHQQAEGSSYCPHHQWRSTNGQRRQT